MKSVRQVTKTCKTSMQARLWLLARFFKLKEFLQDFFKYVVRNVLQGKIFQDSLEMCILTRLKETCIVQKEKNCGIIFTLFET